MGKMWAGRTSGEINKIADDFNSSISFDSRMYRQDITGSIAHAKMLAKCGIIAENEKEALVTGLKQILDDIDSGKLIIDMSCEDIHMFVEQVLTERLGDVGKKLHTARSRNDQVALDLRLYLRDEIDEISDKLKALENAIIVKAEENKNTLMPGFTHLQPAQPITFAQHMLAYAMMFLRDIDRLSDCKKRTNVSPIGSCALAGTTFPTDRRFEASLLEMPEICENSIDGVSDRDFVIELCGTCSIIMMHLSRLSEEMITWSTAAFGFVEISDSYTTGSSIMPQKKNPDMCELARGKTGRVYGDLNSLLTMMKGLPLAYDKDMQEDKERIFDAVDTVKNCLDVFVGMISEMKVNAAKMRRAAALGFINATDLADYLAAKGIPFRTAYKLVGSIVHDCIESGETLESLPIEKYKSYSDEIEEDVYDVINLDACVNRRNSEGGTSPKSVEKQIEYVKNKLV